MKRLAPALALVLSVLSGSSSDASALKYNFLDLSPRCCFNNTSAWGIAGGQQVGYALGATTSHALLWNTSAVSVIDLHPPGWGGAVALATYGGKQVGSGTPPGADYQHALLWSGTAASVVDLTPAGFLGSEGRDIYGNEQVGTAYLLNKGHAMRWSGTAASAVDLHPVGYISSEAAGTSGVNQVGYGTLGSGYRALLWSGTAASVVDLHPGTPFDVSRAYAVSGNEQVGQAFFPNDGVGHALLWHGTAASAVDLNPAGFSYSAAYGTNGVNQVGLGYVADQPGSHALLWSGTADSFIDLHPYVFPPLYPESAATDIDAAGNIVGYVVDNFGLQHAAMWLAVPEPGTVSMMLVFGAALVCRRRKIQRTDIIRA